MTHRIGSQDIEFYMSALVLRVARSLHADYDTLPYAPRQTVLDRATSIVKDILNDDACLRQMTQFVKQHGHVDTLPASDVSEPEDGEGPTLSTREMDALLDCSQAPEGYFDSKPALMRQLAAKKLVRPCAHAMSGSKTAWQVTQAGRDMIAAWHPDVPAAPQP